MLPFPLEVLPVSGFLSRALEKTDPARRRVKVAVIVGLIGGLFSAIVKFGWEVPFPPRTPERNATNPPQTMLEWFGMTPEQSHTAISFNGNDGLPIYSFIVHFGFAIAFGLFYCVVAEYYPRIKLWQGAAFGILVWIGAHLVVMPLLGWVPSPFPWVAGGQTWSEHFSELFGHIIWLWAIEIVRRDLRNRMYVVFAQLVQYHHDEPISKNEFLQMAGRAGRKGLFDPGFVTWLKASPFERRGFDTGKVFLDPTYQ